MGDALAGHLDPLSGRRQSPDDVLDHSAGHVDDALVGRSRLPHLPGGVLGPCGPRAGPPRSPLAWPLLVLRVAAPRSRHRRRLPRRRPLPCSSTGVRPEAPVRPASRLTVSTTRRAALLGVTISYRSQRWRRGPCRVVRCLPMRSSASILRSRSPSTCRAGVARMTAS